MEITVTDVGPDEVQEWVREIAFTLDGRAYTGTFGWNLFDGYRSWLTASDGGPLPALLEDPEFLSALDDFSLDARRALTAMKRHKLARHLDDEWSVNLQF